MTALRSAARTDPGSFHRLPRSFPPALPAERIVIAHPPAVHRRGAGAVAQMLLPVLGSLGIVAFAFIMPSRLFLIVAGAFVLIAVVSALATWWTQRRGGKLSARTERRLYRAHLDERRRTLEHVAARQREVDERLYPDPARLTGLVGTRRHLWERRPADADFLHFRLGHAAVPLACPLELALGDDPMTEYQPELLEQAEALVAEFRTVDDLAIVVSLADASVVTLAGERHRIVGLARAILAQAAALRAPGDLRIMASFSAADEAEWGWLKWLPHVRAGRAAASDSAGGPSLLMALDTAELSRLLEDHVQPRLEQLRRIESSAGEASAELDAPELLLVLDQFHAGDAVARLPLMRELAARGHRLKVRTLCLVREGGAEPPEAALRVLAGADRIEVERTGVTGYRIRPTALDSLSAAGAEALARELAPLQLDESTGTIDLAAEYRVSDLPAAPAGELCAPTGVTEEGDPLVLDLKQAAEGGMGPHGLIVGATGSGKSELLRTIVASLAAHHAPQDLCFVFVDFKGGAAFADLAGLPHSAGMITNLQHDLSLVDRMHAALFGEQQRRQAILRAAGNLDDVAAYRARRAVDPSLEPLPHLLLIVDEFGELLANRPEFIELFLAIGRVGRSLGMHLLLSSQRLEEGRLRGLEGHLRYRICLRTYSAAESKSVLGTPDAFLLPPYPGVGYLSVDTDIYQRFKTARVTAPYRDPEAAGRRAVVEAFDLRALGSAGAVSAADGEPGNGHLTELDVMVRQLRARHRHQGPVHQVWLPPLPERQPLSAVPAPPPWWDRDRDRDAGAPATSGLSATVGLLDRPTEQRQDPLVLDLSGGGGHVAVVGAPQSGKSTLLRTLLTSLFVTYEPDELRAYALDFGGGLLRAFQGAPHLGGVAGKADPERVRATIRQLRALIAEREEHFRLDGIDSMADARVRGRTGLLDPQYAADVLLVIDNVAALLRDHEDLLEDLSEIAVAGLQHGVHLVLSAGRWAEIRPAIRDAIGTRLELRLNDPMESDFGRRVAETVPTDAPGRGITPDALQFLTALPRLDGQATTAGLGEAVASLAAELARRWDGMPAPPVRVLPTEIGLGELPAPDREGVPIAVEELTLAPVRLNLAGGDQHLLVLGDSGSGRTALLRTLAVALARAHAAPGARPAQLEVVDFRRGLSDLAGLPLPTRFATRAPHVEEMLAELRELTVQRLRALDGSESEAALRDRPEVYVLVDDYDLVSVMPMSALTALGDIIFQGRDAGIHVVLARAASGASRAALDPVLSRLVESGAPALLLSGDPHEGPLVRGVRAEPMPPGRGRLLRRRGRPALVQVAYVPLVAPSEETTYENPTGGDPRHALLPSRE